MTDTWLLMVGSFCLWPRNCIEDPFLFNKLNCNGKLFGITATKSKFLRNLCQEILISNLDSQIAK